MVWREGFGDSQRYDRSHLSKSSHHEGQGVPLEVTISLFKDAFYILLVLINMRWE